MKEINKGMKITEAILPCKKWDRLQMKLLSCFIDNSVALCSVTLWMPLTSWALCFQIGQIGTYYQCCRIKGSSAGKRKLQPFGWRGEHNATIGLGGIISMRRTAWETELWPLGGFQSPCSLRSKARKQLIPDWLVSVWCFLHPRQMESYFIDYSFTTEAHGPRENGRGNACFVGT